jgi:hypothetical protein
MTRKHFAAIVAAIALMLLSFVMVRGVWAVGDAQCEAAKHVEMLPAYGYPVTVDPCNDAWAGQWLAPAW